MSGQGGGFNNPLTGSGGTLVIPQIRSDDYQPGSAGWAIFRNGNAEFSDAIIRGLLQLGGDGTPGHPGIQLGVSTVPAELVTYYAGLPDPGTLIPGTLTITYDGTAQAEYRYDAIFADNGVPPNQQLWYVSGLRGGTGVVGETARWLINPGGALGNPDIVFSPTIAFLVKALIQSQVISTAAQAYEVEVAGESGVRFRINGDGSIELGDGTNAPDLILSRDSAKTLRVNQNLFLGGGATGSDVFQVFKASFPANPTTIIDNDGGIFFGPGSTAIDASFGRNSVAQLYADMILALVRPAFVAETWHSVAFAANWGNFGGSVQTVRYRLMPDGTVSLSGGAKTTANVSSPVALFTLPSGYRPAADEIFPTNAPAGAKITVQSSGTVALSDFTGPTSIAILGLSHVRFPLSTL